MSELAETKGMVRELSGSDPGLQSQAGRATYYGDRGSRNGVHWSDMFVFLLSLGNPLLSPCHKWKSSLTYGLFLCFRHAFCFWTLNGFVG